MSQWGLKRYSIGVRSAWFVLFLFMLNVCVRAAPQPNSQHAQDAIRLALRNVVGKPEDIDLTAPDLQKVIRLGLAGKQISDLTPLAKLPNLRELWLHNNRLRELEPASKMTSLEALFLDHNQIRDLAPLGKCTKLRILHLNHNRPKDVLPLSGLRQLEVLNLWQCQLQGLQGLEGLVQMRRLVLYGNR